MSPALSYVLTTRNKLPFLAAVMQRLLARVKADEEIVVSDGASTDGTTEYLIRLRDEGRIQTLLSAPDMGESHGWNRGLLAARGDLIKLITDDDAFCYDCIARCRSFLTEHPAVDVLSGNMGYTNLADPGNVSTRLQPERDFRTWQEDPGRPFWFNGLPVMIRRGSLPITGLMNPGVRCPDTEFSLRITSTRGVKLAWFTGILSIRIDNPRSNTRRLGDAVYRDSERVLRFYLAAEPVGHSDRVRRLAQGLLSRIGSAMRWGKDTSAEPPRAEENGEAPPDAEVIARALDTCEGWFRGFDLTHQPEILFRAARRP